MRLGINKKTNEKVAVKIISKFNNHISSSMLDEEIKILHVHRLTLAEKSFSIFSPSFEMCYKDFCASVCALECRSFLLHLNRLQKVKHKNVIDMKALYETRSHLFLVMELYTLLQSCTVIAVFTICWNLLWLLLGVGSNRF